MRASLFRFARRAVPGRARHRGSVAVAGRAATVKGFAPAIALGIALAACGGSRGQGRSPHLPSGDTHAEAATQGDFDFASQGARGGNVPLRRADARGRATWYGDAFAGKKTASGERFDPRAMTAAHRSLRFGTWVEVTRTDTRQSVRVRVNDRGPHGDARAVIDVSRAAADALDMTTVGFAPVELRIVDGP